MKKKVISFFVAILLVFSFIGCTEKKKAEPIHRTELFMGTAIKVTVYDKQDEEILDKVFKRIIEIEDLVSINKDNTEITNLNKNAGIKGVKLSEDSFNIIKKGLEYSKLSNGGYDVSIGPLVKLWSIGLPEAKVPNKDEIKNVINKIDYKKVKVNDETKEVFLEDKGMMLDLGSIAKGYAADEIVKVLKENNVKQAIIDLGGNIYALGLKDGDKDWKVGIQDPFTERGNVVGSVEVSNKSVVTTGIYERFIEKDGVKYHHILNPKDGYPYKTDIAGVSIIADKSVDADGLSTLVFTKGLDEGIKFIEDLDGVDAIFITNDRKVYTTKGIKDNFKMINESFTLSN
ncbi:MULTISPECIES: FAD:protein FMN transferase [Clostridium]|uniref:FAD:protein FMN transferase n=1 Tax=Clostridium nitritogenes TaxID=83340 RepID=A0ABP3WXE5_9CLOT|nr:FAD:protein FMN transferase [Clostridium baratii]MBT9832112.1 FAD:protein FMN transferase [Clostridium baratii]